jgi:purine-nucleoside phosphorylase
MTSAYDKGLIDLAEAEAKAKGITLNRGVYIGICGPALETPAETRMLRTLGGDATGMSTVIEVIAAVHAGLSVLGLSVISNVNLPDAMAPILIDDIVKAAERAGKDLARLIKGVLIKISEKGKNG